ncbi:MAG: N-acetylglucosamine-6-phosphate deacetylase [Clostridia bacterium]|nr:N-acetylglucosamine-6-phosphate deacetylase [Clostridia bacterium]
MGKVAFCGGKIYDSKTGSFVEATVICRDGMFESIDYSCSRPLDCDVKSMAGRYMIPGLVDVHTHGRGGYDFTGVSDETMPRLMRSYAMVGTTSVMATLASAKLPSLRDSIYVANNYRAMGGAPGCANLIGIHLEGRYLNPSKRGAHPEALLAKPTREEYSELISLMLPTPAHVSFAPELEGGKQFITYLKDLGATVGIAHTAASYEEAVQAVSVGATSFTHTFNAMVGITHRAPGTAGAALACDQAYAELICDGFHVHPEVVKLVYRCKPKDKLVLITDSLEAAGCPDGTYGIAGLPVRVVNGRAINAEGAIAGSTLSMFGAICNLMRYTGATLEEVLPAATINPARMVGADSLIGSIKAGKRADFIIIDDPKHPHISSVYVSAEKIHTDF